MGKVSNFKPQVDNLNLGQTIDGHLVICPKLYDLPNQQVCQYTFEYRLFCLKLKTIKTKKLLFTRRYCSYSLMHCSCPMNSALGAGHQKKKKPNADASKKTQTKCTFSVHLGSTFCTPHVCVYVSFFSFFFFKDQYLVHCSWDMNSVPRHMNSKKRVNNKFLIIFLLFSVFNFQQNKQYPNSVLVFH